MARRFHNFGSMQSMFASGGPALSTGTGRLGEIRAAVYLRRARGFEIVDRNWRNPRDRRQEIDLVCRDRGALVFVEVKTRAQGSLVPGFHAVNSRKKSALRRAIKAYLTLIRAKPRTFRFDVVEVEAGGGIRHFRNVELFSKHYRP